MIPELAARLSRRGGMSKSPRMPRGGGVDSIRLSTYFAQLIDAPSSKGKTTDSDSVN